MGRLCSVPDCLEEARQGGRCYAHHKRATRGADMTAPVARKPKTRWEALVAAVEAYANASTLEEEDGSFERLKVRLRMAARSYVLGPRTRGKPHAVP